MLRIGALALFVIVALAGCRSRGDDAAGVATPSLTLPAGEVTAGHPVQVVYRFAVAANAPSFAEDYAVFVHAFNEAGTRLWTDDHLPPTGTRKWMRGDVIEYSRTMLVPRRVREGTVNIDVGLYSSRTGDRLPLNGTSTGRRSYRIGSLRVAPPANDAPAIFVEGWHRTETSGEADGVEWHWSRGNAELWFRNPKRDSTLVLQLDRPVSGSPEPARVEIRNGAMMLAGFELPTGQLQLHTIAVPAAALGPEDIARISISVDKPFVPADVPAAASSDTRELGVRVFEAQLVGGD